MGKGGDDPSPARLPETCGGKSTIQITKEERSPRARTGQKKSSSRSDCPQRRSVPSLAMKWECSRTMVDIALRLASLALGRT